MTIPSNVPTLETSVEVTEDNVAQLLATTIEVVKKLVSNSTSLSADDKNIFHGALTAAEKVETPEEKQAREEREAKIADLQAQLAEAQAS